MTKLENGKPKLVCPTCGSKRLGFMAFALFGVLSACKDCNQLGRVIFN